MTPSPRVACLFVPLFPLAARLRSEPELKGGAVAIFEGNGNTARVIAATRKAREKGIEPGMTLPQARSLFPKLVARGRDLESERAAEEALLEVADSFSPRVEDASGGVVYFDIEGLPGITSKSEIRNPKSEIAFGNDIITAAEKASLPARVGIAGSKLAARVAANLPDSPRVVPEGEEAAFLAPLPLSKLAPDMEIADTLERWGIRAIGELAKLPEAEVASRLGELGRQLHATARGIDLRPLEPRLPSPCFSEGMELEWPLLTLEPFLFLGNAALERLVQRLESQALACTRLEIGLKLDPDGCDARAITLPAPTRDVKTLLTLVRLELEARPPGAPVVGFTFTARPDKPRRAQLSLFGPAALSPDKLATTIARLAALLGADRVGSPRTVDGHRPERFTEVSYTPPPPPELARPPKSGRGLLSIRVLRPPVALEVIVDPPLSPWERAGVRGEQEPLHNSSAPITNHKSQITNSSRPVSLKSSSPDATPPIQGTVKVAAGPWSMEEGWWSETPADRAYWDIELSDGALYRIYRNRATGSWFADGIYD